MKTSPPRRIVAGLLAVASSAAACRTAPTPSPTPPAATHPAATVTATSAAASATSSGAVTPPAHVRHGYTEADVRFMQGMIHHHAQALAMVALVPTRTSREDMRQLARRIDVSQRDEIALMRHWLEDHHEDAPSLDAPSVDAPMAHHDTTGHQMAMPMPMSPAAVPMMPGMLSPEQMAQLGATSGAAFDRLFLEDMIHHHEGALKMVTELFATPGAGQDPEIFRFAADVDADQRAEIARMRALLSAMPNG